MSLKDTFGVDRAFALSYAGYRYREGPMKRELSRIGILDEMEIVYTFDNPFDAVTMKSVVHDKKLDKNPGMYNLTMGHYGIVKRSLALGYGSILIVEDDCRFLLDVGKIREEMMKAPDGWEVLVLDSFKEPYADGTGWLPCRFSRSSAAYCISTSGMSKLVGLIEGSLKKGGKPLNNIDSYFDPHMLFEIAKAYRAFPNLAIQVTTGGNSISGICEKMYEAIGIDPSAYARF